MSEVLYRSQAAAGDVHTTSLFPCYSPEYVQSQGVLVGCYSKIYNVASMANSAAHFAGSAAYTVGDFGLGWAIRPVLNVVYPINPINGNHHFTGIPRSFEKVLGEYVFYPLATSGMRKTHERLSGERIADKVEGVLTRLKNANGELLNPPGETEFDYRVKTVHSSMVNAFAVPAGGMVVFDQIVKEINGAIRSGQFRETTVEFADGSKARVDLSSVTVEDTLAALMGHEMTHAASRHSIVRIVAGFIHKILLNVGRFVLVGYLQSRDAEYQELKKKPENQLLPSERAALESREELYSRLNDFFAWIQGKFEALEGLFNSRSNEYEADVTGAYFAHQAGFNPLGALYLQEVLAQEKGAFTDTLHKHLEFLFTHPYGENRKRALFAAIQEMRPKALEGAGWEIASHGYDMEHSSPGITYAHHHSRPRSG